MENYITENEDMNKKNLAKIIQRYSDNFAMVNNKEHDEIFKWKTIKQFRDVWFSENAKNLPFSEMFKAAKSECSVIIDNGHVSPTNGIVKLAEKRPKEVEYLFRDVLLGEDNGSIDKRQDNMERFLDEMEKLRQEVFPEKWKYKQERHAASCYLFFVKPDENYIYRYTDAEEFAKYMEFGMDIGVGDSFSLANYYKMCDEIVEELKKNQELLKKHFECIDSDKNYYRDESLHLLAFDLMYCARCYNFYDGLEHKTKKDSIKEYTLEKLREKERLELEDKITYINMQLRELELSLEGIEMISLLGVKVQQKRYGEGVVVKQNQNKVTVRFKDCEKTFVLSKNVILRPTFANDEEIIEVFTQYGNIMDQIKKLEKQLNQLMN